MKQVCAVLLALIVTGMGISLCDAQGVDYKGDVSITGTVTKVEPEDMVSMQTDKGMVKLWLPGAAKVVKEGHKFTVHVEYGNLGVAGNRTVGPTQPEYTTCIADCDNRFRKDNFGDISAAVQASKDRCMDGCRYLSSSRK